jgi:hypothetical protein
MAEFLKGGDIRLQLIFIQTQYKGATMPIRELINLAFIILLGICITHPMTAAITIRKVELSILSEASDTRSWGNPVWLPNEKSISRTSRRVNGADHREFFNH